MSEDSLLSKFRELIIPKIIKKYNPEKVLLFGSRIKGSPTKGSDIDVIIVSEKFEDIKFLNRMPKILKEFRFERHVDYLCYTPEEFKQLKDNSTVLMDALKYGELIPISK